MFQMKSHDFHRFFYRIDIYDTNPVFCDFFFSVLIFYAQPFSFMDGPEDISIRHDNSDLHSHK